MDPRLAALIRTEWIAHCNRTNTVAAGKPTRGFIQIWLSAYLRGWKDAKQAVNDAYLKLDVGLNGGE